MKHPVEEAIGRVHTKIVATVGPASRSPERIDQLIRAGVDVFRLNFSHGSHDDHAATYRLIHESSRALARPVAILMDLCGPKLRLGQLPDGQVECLLGQEFEIVPADQPAAPGRLTCTYPGLQRDLKPGQSVLFADGQVAMVVQEADPERARLRATQPGTLRSNQGINLPETALGLPSLTEKDLNDLDWAASNPVDYIALSFVQTAADVAGLRRELVARRIDARVIAKIEKPRAVEDFAAIAGLVDAVMVARGDLGVEMDVVKVPGVQKRLIGQARFHGKPGIVATEMLASMERSSRPTRAEASDVFNAVLDGADAVMLSAETAVGQYPIEAVRMMSRIVAEAEAGRLVSAGSRMGREAMGGMTDSTCAIVRAAAAACQLLEPALIVAETATGRTALALSDLRLPTPVVALSSDPAVVRSMCLFWGITPLGVPDLSDATAALRVAIRWAAAQGMVLEGQTVLTILGRLPGHRAHQSLRIHQVTADDLGGAG